MKRLWLVCVVALSLVALILWLPALRAAPLRAAANAPAASFDRTFTVTNIQDAVDETPGDGQCQTIVFQCTLRAAIDEANIQFTLHPTAVFTILLPTALTPTTYFVDIEGDNEDHNASGDLDVRSPLTIRALGGSSAIIDMRAADRVFDIITVPGSRLTLDGITVQHGSNVSQGGGIFAGNDLTLTNSAVLSNSVTTSFGDGGGIWGSTSRIVLDHSIVRGNSVAAFSTSATSRGGGIYSFGTLLITASVVSANRVSVTGGGSIAEGGGILFAGSILSATNSTFSRNVLSTTGGAIGEGGAVSLDFVPGTVAFYSDTFSANSGAGYGGAIYAYLARVDIEHSSIANQAPGVSLGGGLFLISSTVLLRDSSVANNQASNGGGALVGTSGQLAVERSTFSLNSAGVQGGAIDNRGVLTLTNSTLFLNEVGGQGGGLQNTGTATLNSDTFSVNIAQFDCVCNGDGGGIWNDAGGVVYMRNTVLDNIDVGGEAPDCRGTINVLDYNLVHSNANCNLLGAGSQHNLVGQASGLGLLADNGGPTLTSAPNANSPLIDAGNPAGCVDEHGTLLRTDQRGLGRTADGDHNGSARCDIGAYETQWEVYLPALRR